MFEEKALNKINLALKSIRYIEKLCKNKGGIVKALKDEGDAQSAIMMEIIKLNQKIEKLNEINAEELKNFIPNKEQEIIRKTRNISTHDYESLFLATVEKTIRFHLPIIKQGMINMKKFLIQQIPPKEMLIKKLKDYENRKKVLFAETEQELQKEILNLYAQCQKNGDELDKNMIKKIKNIQNSQNKGKSR